VDEDLTTVFVQQAITDLDPCGDADDDTTQEDLIEETVAGILEDWEYEAKVDAEERAALAYESGWSHNWDNEEDGE
jgi:acyl-homoserine lactone acylase PvdQ